MLKYKLIEEVNAQGSTVTKDYSGFTHHITEANIKGNILVLAWIDGEAEYWIVDPEGGMLQLHQFYFDLVGELPRFTYLQELP